MSQVDHMKITDDKRAAKASAAHTLCNSEAFLNAMTETEADLSERWKTAPDTESREAVFYEYNGVREIAARLKALAGEWEVHIEATKED